jgi:hypothetical protein
MIRFFRNIRKKLLQQNRFSKYLLYAIGEIALVMIGILLALQVNNWNEHRKSKKMANEIYQNLLTSLKQDSVEVQRTIDLLSKSLETKRKMITEGPKQIPKDLKQSELDEMVRNISGAVMSFFPKTGVYDLVVSNNGMDLLESQEIKAALINLYDFQYKRYENVDHIIDNKYHYYLGPLIRKDIGFIGAYDSESNFEILTHVSRNQFIDHYEQLVSESQDIYGILSTGNNYLIQIRKSIHELLYLIRNELNPKYSLEHFAHGADD